MELTAPLLKSAVLRGIELGPHKIPHVPPVSRSFWKRHKVEQHAQKADIDQANQSTEVKEHPSRLPALHPREVRLGP